MIILLTNDDGIYAPGLHALERAFADLGDVWVVAPEVNQTAVSRAISLNRALRADPRGEKRFAVDGTPADCAYLGILHLLPERPALVVSGINRGNNLGDDVLYSGTVGAAAEACMCGVPALAVSLGYGGERDFAGRVARRVAEEVLSRGLPPRTLLNLNLPAHPAPAWRLHVAPLGRRDYHRQVERRLDPRGRPYYWLGGPSIGHEPIPDTDLVRNAEGHATLSLISPEFSLHPQHATLDTWGVASLDHEELPA